jgi:hypothetical protein
MNRSILGAAILLLAGIAAAAPAAAGPNLVANGSFENGLADWTRGGADGGNAVAAINYGNPPAAYGEAVPANDASTNSPDAAGNDAAYFVSDDAVNQSISQWVHLAAGVYQVGFSAYLPHNGFANPGNATFSGVILGDSLANFTASTLAETTWQSYSGRATIAAEGDYQVNFVFNSFGGASKDVVIDQVYVVAGDPPLPAPEPATIALFGTGLLCLGVARRARARS